MTRHIKLFCLLTSLLTSILVSCKQKETSSVNYEHKAKISSSLKTENVLNYDVWYFSSENADKKYQDIKIFISNDSIKVMDKNILKCKEEIVKEKMTFPNYFKSKKNADEIKEELKKKYGLNNLGNELIVISNINGDLSEEGCLFPFNDLFILDNHLFYYDKGYHCFTPNEDKKSITKSKVDYIKKTTEQLPYNKKVDLNNVVYNKLEASLIKGIEDFSCGQEELRYLSLPSKNDINLILVPQDCGDFAYRFYLLTIKENKVISNLYVEGEFFEPENFEDKTITSFLINEQQIIQVKTIEQVKGKTKDEFLVSYKINGEGKIEKK